MSFETHSVKPGFRLHVKTTKQFKTTRVRIFLTRNLDANTTAAALLPYILRRGTRSLGNMTRISRHLENLYGTIVGTDISKLGEWQVLSFFADVPNERHLPTKQPLLRRTLEFLNELVFHPAGNGAFDDNYVKTEIDNMRKFISSLPENRASYSHVRLLETMCRGEPYARYEYGDLDTLDRIRPPGLFRFYRALCRRAPVDIYIHGDVEPGVE